MIIKDVKFIKSAVQVTEYPEDTRSEILLSGRSNVGKSSFINSMLNRKNLAHTSSRPGKTQTLNFFLINEEFYFVDIPGYGYARVSKKDRENFGVMIENYLVNRDQLKLVVLLVDFRHKPSQDDVLMYEYLKAYDIPCLVIGTKQDKVSKNQYAKQEKMIKKELGIISSDMFVAYSSETGNNKEIIHKIMEEYL